MVYFANKEGKWARVPDEFNPETGENLAIPRTIQMKKAQGREVFPVVFMELNNDKTTAKMVPLTEEEHHRKQGYKTLDEDVLTEKKGNQDLHPELGHTIGTQALNGAIGGFLPQAYAAGKAILEKVEGNKKPFGDIYKTEKDAEQEYERVQKRDHPTGATVGNVLGSILPFAGALKGLQAAKLIKNGLKAPIIENALAGAATEGVNSTNSAINKDESPQEVAKNAVEGAALGGVGGVLGLGAENAIVGGIKAIPDLIPHDVKKFIKAGFNKENYRSKTNRENLLNELTDAPSQLVRGVEGVRSDVGQEKGEALKNMGKDLTQDYASLLNQLKKHGVTETEFSKQSEKLNDVISDKLNKNFYYANAADKLIEHSGNLPPDFLKSLTRKFNRPLFEETGAGSLYEKGTTPENIINFAQNLKKVASENIHDYSSELKELNRLKETLPENTPFNIKNYVNHEPLKKSLLTTKQNLQNFLKNNTIEDRKLAGEEALKRVDQSLEQLEKTPHSPKDIDSLKKFLQKDIFPPEQKIDDYEVRQILKHPELTARRTLEDEDPMLRNINQGWKDIFDAENPQTIFEKLYPSANHIVDMGKGEQMGFESRERLNNLLDLNESLKNNPHIKPEIKDKFNNLISELQELSRKGGMAKKVADAGSIKAIPYHAANLSGRIGRGGYDTGKTIEKGAQAVARGVRTVPGGKDVIEVIKRSPALLKAMAKSLPPEIMERLLNRESMEQPYE